MNSTPSLWTVLKVWLGYFLPFLPYCPAIGRPEDGDCAFVQSFGRNNYSDFGLSARLRRLRDQGRMNDIRTFGLLYKDGFDAGAPNRALALEAIMDYQKFGDPIQAQWEVAFAMWEKAPHWYRRHATEIDCVWPTEDNYFSAYHVIELCKQLSRLRRRYRPRLIAHPAMRVRVVPILWKLTFNPVVESVSIRRFRLDPLWVLDQDSVQRWTRDFGQWIRHETPGRAALLLISLVPRLNRLIPVSTSSQLGPWLAFLPPQRL